MHFKIFTNALFNRMSLKNAFKDSCPSPLGRKYSGPLPRCTWMRVSMGWWLLRLSAKILALLRLSVNFFQLRLTKRLKNNFFCFKKLNIN